MNNEIAPTQSAVTKKQWKKLYKYIQDVQRCRYVLLEADKIEDWVIINGIPLPENPRQVGLVYQGQEPYLMVIDSSKNENKLRFFPYYHVEFGVPYFWEIRRPTEEQLKDYDGVVQGFGWTDLWGNPLDSAVKGFGSGFNDEVVGFYQVPHNLYKYLHTKRFPNPWMYEE
jgi:hypothetical protein